MKRVLGFNIQILSLLVFVLLLAGATFAAWNDPWFRKTPKENRILMYGQDGSLEDTGVTVGSITNTIVDVATVSNQVAVINATTNGPNQFAKLDENGKISTNAFTHIYVIYTGGYAF